MLRLYQYLTDLWEKASASHSKGLKKAVCIIALLICLLLAVNEYYELRQSGLI